MKSSSINWRLVGYTVGGCWLLFASMFLLLGKQIAMFLNPLPVLVKGLAGGSENASATRYLDTIYPGSALSRIAE